jgi:hypothetical protein
MMKPKYTFQRLSVLQKVPCKEKGHVQEDNGEGLQREDWSAETLRIIV